MAATTERQPTTNLGDVVRATRTSLGYRVYCNVGKERTFTKPYWNKSLIYS